SDRAQRVRRGPGQEGQTHPGLSDDHRPQLRRGAARDRLAATHRQAQGGDAGELEARRGRDRRRVGVGRGRQEAVHAGLEGAQALYPHRAAAARLNSADDERSSSRRELAVLIELVISAFVAAYAAVVALGHVLLVAAIYKGPREDDTSGWGR